MWTRSYHILDVLVFWFIRGSCYSLPSTQRLSIKCGPMEAALWTFDCIIELTWARGLDRKTSSNRERASSTPSFDDDAAKKSLSMNDLLRWKVLPTAIGSREGWTKRCILYISFDLVRFMTKTNKNRRKSHYWTRENSRQNLTNRLSERTVFFTAVLLWSNIYVVYSCCVHPEFWTSLLHLPCEMQSSLFKFLGIGHTEASENSGSFVVTATSHKSRYCRAGTLRRGVFSRLPFTALHCKGLHKKLKNKEKGP